MKASVVSKAAGRSRAHVFWCALEIKMHINIRLEREDDYRCVEELTRKAFWNLHCQGCDEHYLAHIMRSHPDFCPDLDFVAEYEGRVIGSIMYTKAHLVNGRGDKIPILTFGPVSVLPEYQRRGVGSQLIQHTIRLAEARGVAAIVIFGNPSNYVKHGFRGCKDFMVAVAEGRYPTCMLVLPLLNQPWPDGEWLYQGSEVYSFDKNAAEEFDRNFPPFVKKHMPSQEEFAILCRSIVV